jgi:plastocyanin
VNARRLCAALGFVLAGGVSFADTPPLPKAHVVVMEELRFRPASLTVQRGDRVTWVNRDLFPHTATADGHAFDSKDIAPNASWTLVVREAGTFAYACAFHPMMKGILTVQDARHDEH